MHPNLFYFSIFSPLALSAVLPLYERQTTQQSTLLLHSNPSYEQSTDDTSQNGYRIPTVHESAVMARRILHLQGIATLATTFPTSSSSSLSSDTSTLQNSDSDSDSDSISTPNPNTKDIHPLEDRPDSVAQTPFSLIEYYTDCEPSTGNPTLLAVTISTTFKNARAGSNVSFSLRYEPPLWEEGTYSAAKLPRFSLSGYLEDIDPDTISEKDIKTCFLNKHPDVIWTPGNDIHESKWVRFVTREVYWFGGFGDRAFIGWIPRQTWEGVTMEEIEGIRLPGEHGGGGEDDRIFGEEL